MLSIKIAKSLLNMTLTDHLCKLQNLLALYTKVLLFYLALKVEKQFFDFC